MAGSDEKRLRSPLMVGARRMTATAGSGAVNNHATFSGRRAILGPGTSSSSACRQLLPDDLFGAGLASRDDRPAEGRARAVEGVGVGDAARRDDKGYSQ